MKSEGGHGSRHSSRRVFKGDVERKGKEKLLTRRVVGKSRVFLVPIHRCKKENFFLCIGGKICYILIYLFHLKPLFSFLVCRECFFPVCCPNAFRHMLWKLKCAPLSRQQSLVSQVFFLYGNKDLI